MGGAGSWVEIDPLLLYGDSQHLFYVLDVFFLHRIDSTSVVVPAIQRNILDL